MDTREDNAPVEKLLRISKERISELSLLKEQYITFQETWDYVLANPELMVKALQPHVKELLENRSGEIEFRDTDLSMFLKERIVELIGSSPISVPIKEPIERPVTSNGKGTMILDGTSQPFKYFRDIIMRTAEWLIANGKLTHRAVPIELGPSRYLLNSSRDNPDGKKMIRPKKLSNGLFIETNASSYDCERWARKLMRECGVDDSRLKIKRNE